MFIDREAREIMHLVASVRPSVCPFVCALTAEQVGLKIEVFFGLLPKLVFLCDGGHMKS